MTTSDMESRRRWAAEKCMGWQVRYLGRTAHYFHDTGTIAGSVWNPVKDWKPDEDPAQMMMLVEAMAQRSLDEWIKFSGSLYMQAQEIEPGTASTSIAMRVLVRAGYYPTAVLIAACSATGFTEEEPADDH